METKKNVKKEEKIAEIAEKLMIVTPAERTLLLLFPQIYEEAKAVGYAEGIASQKEKKPA